MIFRPGRPDDALDLLTLNAASVAVLSPLTPERLAALRRNAALDLVAERDGAVSAFVLAFREGATYDSVNYQWFANRYTSFLYVDRVVVGEGERGKGVGRALYARVFAAAREASVEAVTCEIDVVPPNPASVRFHAAQGFREVGRQQVAGGTKTVSLQAAPL